VQKSTLRPLVAFLAFRYRVGVDGRLGEEVAIDKATLEAM